METNKNTVTIDFTDDLELNEANNIASEPESVVKFRNEVAKMTENYIRKNHDYGDSYAKSVEVLGIIGGVEPIFNKCNRLVQLAKSEKALVKDETIEDTLLDMASYCVMLKIALGNGRNESK